MLTQSECLRSSSAAADLCGPERSHTNTSGRRTLRCNCRTKVTKSPVSTLRGWMRKYKFSRCRRGDTVRTPMADNRSRRSQAFWIGVLPRGAHVRRRTGCNMKPVSSRNAIKASLRVPLFYARPFLLPPASHFRVVSFAGLLFGHLTRPAPPVQQRAHVVGMIMNAVFSLDQLGHAGAGPQIAGKTGFHRSLGKNPQQPLLLPASKPRLGAWRFLGFQCLETSVVECRFPTGSRGRSHLQQSRHLSDTLALLKHLRRQDAAHLQLFAS